MKNYKNYNIVSNKYLENHDTKIVDDDKILRNEAAIKYWKTHDFDVVNCKYYDKEKEDEYA